MRSKKILAGREDTFMLSLLKRGAVLGAFVLVFAIMISAAVAGTWEKIEYNSGTFTVQGSTDCTGSYCFFTTSPNCPSTCTFTYTGYGVGNCCCPYPDTTMTIYKPGGTVGSSISCPSSPCSLTYGDCSLEGQQYAIWDRMYGRNETYTCGSTSCTQSASACVDLPARMRINTRYVNWDANGDDCDCLGGGDGESCSLGENICWTGSKCCGDDVNEVYEEGTTGGNCCYDGRAILHNQMNSYSDSRLLCYNGNFYQCGTGAYTIADRADPCNKIGSYYCHPNGYWTSSSTEEQSCGSCKKCESLQCKDLCVPCQWCSTGEVCEWLGPGSSDARCAVNGSIDCGGWYSKSGRKGPDDDAIQQCLSYANITSEQCKTQGCKVANSSDCETWSYPYNLEYECGECKYIQNGDCFNNTLGTCTNYITNTPCRKGGYYGKCDGAGTCNVVTKCADGTPVGNCSVTKPQYCNVYGELYDDCERCGCPDGFDCLFSGHCINPNFDCSAVLTQSECNNNAPTCFWNGTGCFFCANVTACGSYTPSGKSVCEADTCGLTRASSNCSWNGISCYEYFFIEDCFNSIDDDGDYLADCDDLDCSSSAYCSGGITCGDGVINPGEECDIGIFPYGWDSCTDFSYGGGTLACYPQGTAGQCKFDFSGCTNPMSTAYCSNGTIESGESCDGTALGGASCESLGFFSGNLACLNCHFDTWKCIGAVTHESNPYACNDTIDNDNDDYIDYMDEDCQDQYVKPNPKITREGGDCAPGNKTATAILTYTYYLRFGLEDKTITKDVKITCPIPLSARLPFFSLLSFLITVTLLFVYYLLREKKAIKA